MIIELGTDQKKEIDRLAMEHRRSVFVYCTPDNTLHVRWKGDPPVEYGILVYERILK